MARVKIVIRRTENNGSCNATFSERREGIIKKAVELGMLCDSDISLIMLGPYGRLICFPCNHRVEDLVVGFARCPKRFGGGSEPDEEAILERLRQIQRGREIAARLSRIEDLQREVRELTEELRAVQARLRNYEPVSDAPMSIEQVETCERFLVDALNRINEIKQEILREHVPPELRPVFQARMTGQNGILPVPLNVGDMTLPSGSSLQISNAFVASDAVIPTSVDNTIVQVNMEHVEPEEPDRSGGNLPHQGYTSTELLATVSAPTLPEIETAIDNDVSAGMPNEQEEAGPGTDGVEEGDA